MLFYRIIMIIRICVTSASHVSFAFSLMHLLSLRAVERHFQDVIKILSLFSKVVDFSASPFFELLLLITRRWFSLHDKESKRAKVGRFYHYE